MSNKIHSSLMVEAGAFFLHVRTGRVTFVISDEERVLKMPETSCSVTGEDVGQLKLMT